ncbi:MAG: hypothetical protein AAB919_01365 [Patescibacteria group bacterium]
MKKFSIAVAILFFGLTLAPAFAGAQFGDTPANSAGNFAPANSGANAAPANSGNNSIFSIQNPLGGGVDSFCKLIKALFNVIILFGIPIATFFVMYSGFRLVMARGNPEALKRARLNLFYTMAGIAIFLGAWLLAQVISATIKDLNVNVPGLNNC